MPRDRDPVSSLDFDAFFVAQYPQVLRATRYVVGDRAVAEELAQDAFVKLLRNWSKVRRYDRPDLWVRTVALRDSQRERRRTWRRPALEALAAPPDVQPAPDVVAADVLSAVAALPVRQRAVVVLFYLEDRPMEEIAEILGCAVSTGWSHLQSARKRLAELLAEEVIDDVR
jgi:RNA polymerase sigma factor (sigma-70 family)